MNRVLQRSKSFFKNYREPIKRSLILIGFLVMLAAILSLSLNIRVVGTTSDRISSARSLGAGGSDYDCILILGAGIRADGSPTPMLYDRLTTGAVASVACDDAVILLSGDSQNESYTETVTMRDTLLEMGIDEERIVCDGWGLSTYESIWRAKYVYGFDKILIVSQKYHLYRALYLADQLGLEARGADAALRSYGKQPIYDAREYLARIKDAAYSVIMPRPQFTEKWEDIYG